MAGSAVIKVEANDSDQRFREKCNTNFAQLARGLVLDGQSLQVIADSDAVTDIVLAMNDKVSYQIFNDAIIVISDELNLKLELSNLIEGPGIRLTKTASNVTIEALCPTPISGIFFIDAPTNPTIFWPGTTWEPFVQTGVPCNAWKRLT